MLILLSRCVPFIQVPFSSQPDKLNLLQPDSPADFTACFVYSTSCFYLAQGGSDKWHESTAIGATMTTYSTSCRSYKLYVFQTGLSNCSATCKADYVRNKCVISNLPERSHRMTIVKLLYLSKTELLQNGPTRLWSVSV